MPEDYDLRKSVEALGKLTPVLKDAHGNVIDGLHRLQIYPDWPCVTVGFVDTPEKLEAARLAVNTNRRLVSSSEIAMRVEFLAKAGLKVEQIVAMSGLSKTTIYKYMPQELKDKAKVEAGVASGVTRVSVPPAEQTVKIQYVECERCKINTSSPKDWRGHQLCDECCKRAELNPEASMGFFHYAKKQVVEPKAEVRGYKPTETWEQRKAVMSPAVSRMDEAVFLALQRNEALRSAGWKFEFQKRYCIKEVTSDVTATRGDVEKPLFLDGEVHIGREDRDEANRDLLAKRLGISETLTFKYEGAYSDAKRDELMAKIVGALA